VRLALVLVVAACGGDPPPPVAPAAAAVAEPPAEPAGIRLEPQRPGDAARGYATLVESGYVGCGVPRSLWNRFGWTATEATRIPRKRGADLPYYMNAATTPAGVEIVTANCLGCHAGFLRGKLVIGLGDTATDYTQSVGDEVALAQWLVHGAERDELAKLVSRVRALAPHVRMRSAGANPADHIAAVLFAHRDPKTLAWSDEPRIPLPADPPIPVDVPAWWLMKKKTAMFHTGAGRGDHARIMMSASVLCVDDVATARAIDDVFPDVRAYILSLEAPRFPGPIDRPLADAGKRVFQRACASCHGTYGAGARYASRVIATDKIGTDPLLARRAAQFAQPFTDWFNRGWFGERARLEPGDGYVAPPLDGVWATAPYFHNGSVPNLAAVLDSSLRRPRTKIVRDDYDLTAVGWQNVAAAPDDAPAWVYDAAQPGYANGGHLFGDRLSPADRSAVLEYLKTL
jgi:mono/diheme cytochrome c family protein